MADLEVRRCSWQGCLEPALPDQPFCLTHADVTEATPLPERIRMLLERAARLSPEAKTDAEIKRKTAANRSSRRKSRRRIAVASRSAQRRKR